MTKLKRGQKACKQCGTINGVRSFYCKNCDAEFKMKKFVIKRPKKVLVSDHSILKKGDNIKVIGGSGNYYLTKEGEKQYFTDRGKYVVMDTDTNGIHAWGKSGYSYLYMGKERESSLLDNMFNAPHKVLLVKSPVK